jgi:hypothetical protein
VVPEAGSSMLKLLERKQGTAAGNLQATTNF